MTYEVWQEVPSFPDVLASSLGRVRNKDRVAKMPNGGLRTYECSPSYGRRVGKPDMRGKYRLKFSVKGERTTGKGRQRIVLVSRLVCEAFHGPPPFPGAVCSHKDENPENNRKENLEWTTQKKNLNMPLVKEYHRSRTGENNPLIKGMRKAILPPPPPLTK